MIKKNVSELEADCFFVGLCGDEEFTCHDNLEDVRGQIEEFVNDGNDIEDIDVYRAEKLSISNDIIIG